MRYTVEEGGRTVAIEVTRAQDGSFLVSVEGGAPRRWSRLVCGDGEGRLVDEDARSWPYGSHVHGDAVAIVHRGHARHAVLVDPRVRGAASSTGASADEVKTPMPGAIARVLVRPGDEVHAGQVLVVVEAMKMENEFKAPRDGRVAEVPAAGLRAVEAGALLVRLEKA